MELGRWVEIRKGRAGCKALLDHGIGVVHEFAIWTDRRSATRGLVEEVDFVSTRQEIRGPPGTIVRCVEKVLRECMSAALSRSRFP